MNVVLYFQHVSSLGGSGLCLLKLIQGLDKTKFKPLVVLREDGPLVPMLEQAGAIIYFDKHQYLFGYCSGFHPEWWELGLYRSILRFPLSVVTGFRWARKLNPDIVHVNSMALIASGVGAKLAGARTALHIREQALKGWFGFRRRCIALIMNYFFDGIFAICEANRIASGIDQSRCEVVYDWVSWEENASFDTHALRERLSIEEDTSVILFVGGESKVKGTDIFLKALSQLSSDQKIKVISAGAKLVAHKRRTREYRTLLDKLEREVMVPFIKVGIVENIGEYMALCDFLVVPSAVPHFSNPVAEAGWLGKPSIMSNDLIGQEMIDSGKDGLLFDSQQPADLAQKMEYLLGHSRVCESLRAQSQKRAFQLYSKRNIHQIERKYLEIVNGK